MSEARPAQPTADRNLLFGILAVQLDFISRDALIAGMSAWVLDKARPLGHILVEQKALSSERQALLAALVQEHIQQHGNNPQQSLAAVGAAPVCVELQRIQDPDLQTSLSRSPCSGATAADDPYATRAPVAAGAGGAAVRFQILRPHAGGGLGEVFVAHDQELHREVALKQIRDQHADHPDSRSRFMLEAEITGKLEHPGIVPVYGLGTYADGRPFYAMRFIEGDSLKEAIDRFHRSEPASGTRDPGERTLQLRQLLARFIAVCNALAYAHSRGILHRDLKPGNIMLGKYGETLVVDWGLAKALHSDAPGAGTKARPLRPTDLQKTEDTAVGSAIGTPQYMSPEQAAGRLDRLGPASDVYSLGATLYCLLTGKPPFEDPDVAAVLQKVQKGDFPRPRQVQRGVPVVLEAICLKAMALHRRDRYSSCRALADDIEHWLADEPVSAHRESLPVRLARWRRRHRGTVIAVSLAVMVGFLALLGGAIWHHRQVERERARTQMALEASQEQTLRLYVANGTHLMDAGNLSDALVWFTEALHRDVRGGLHERMHRTRVAAVLDRCPQLEQMLFHQASLRHAAFDPEGRRLVTASNDDTARVWDLYTGQPVGPSLKHAAPVVEADFSPDGRRVVSCSEDSTARVWEVGTGRQISVFHKHRGTVREATFSPDGQRVATADAGGLTWIWDPATGKELLPPLKHDAAVRSVKFNPAGSRVVTASADGRARVWDACSGKLISQFTGHIDQVVHVEFSADGRHVLSASADHTACLWEADTGREAIPPLRHQGEVTRAVFSPDGRQILTTSEDMTGQLWDARTGARIGEPLRHLSGVRYGAFSRDGQAVITASDDNTSRVWETATGKLLLPTLVDGGSLSRSAFNRQGDRIVTVSDDNTVSIWSTRPRGRPPLEMAHGKAVRQVVFSSDGQRLATASDDGTARLWDTRTAQPLSPPLRHEGAVLQVLFSPDGKALATASTDGTARLWNLADGKDRILTRTNQSVTAMAFSPDGRCLLTAGPDGTARLWGTASGQPLGQTLCHQGAITAVGFSPDGRRVVTASSDGTARLWDSVTGQPLGNPLRHQRVVNTAVFSPDGEQVLTASDDHSAQVWDAATGAPVGQPLVHASPIKFAVFSADGKRAVTGSTDNTARIWDVATARLTAPPLVHNGTLRFGAFSPDGHCVVTASEDQTARVWDADQGEALTPCLHHARRGKIAHVAFSPDGQQVATASEDGTARLWQLHASEEPVEDLRRWASLLSAKRIDEKGRLVPVDGPDLRQIWKAGR